MADFKEILLNVELLKEEFSKLNFKEADKVKENFEKAKDSLKSIPPQVLKAIEETGFSLSDFEIKVEVPVEREVVVKERKKRTLELEKQSFAVVDNELKLAIGRAKSSFESKGITVLSYADLDKKQQAKAAELVENYNNR